MQCSMHYFDRKQLLGKPHNFIHLNLAIALFLAFLIFVAGIETAKNNVVYNKVCNFKYELSVFLIFRLPARLLQHSFNISGSLHSAG